MELYLLRHAIAVERGTTGRRTDFDRALSREGQQRLRQVAKALRRLELRFDQVLTSPYVRARQTAEEVIRTLGLEGRLEICEALRAEKEPREVLRNLMARTSLPERLLLVGHEPLLSGLISLLVSGRSGLCVTLKKAGLAKLTTGSLHLGRCATLDWLLTPKQMLLIA